MTDKVQKIREEVERLKRWNDNVRDSTRHMTLQEEDFNRGKHSSYLEILNFIDSLQKEPLSEEWIDVAKQYVKEHVIGIDKVTFSIATDMFISGAKWQKAHNWKPADGDDLPEYDKEVIAILDYDFGHYKVVYAHRPNPNGWNGTNIDTGEKEHFEPEIYDKGGWNQPHVLYWLDAKLPYEENKIIKKETITGSDPVTI